MAQFGKIHSPLYRDLLPFVDTTIYGTTVQVQQAADVSGCNPSLQNWTGKVAWYFDNKCDNFGLGTPGYAKWKTFQDAGAVGIIVSAGPHQEIGTSQIFFPKPEPGAIPVVQIAYVQDFTNEAPSPTNPQITGLFFAVRGMPNATISAVFDTPDANQLLLQRVYPASPWGFVVYSATAFHLLVLIFLTGKLAQFILHEGGPKLSLPQSILTLSWISSFLCLLTLIYGPTFGTNAWQRDVTSWFNVTFIPWWCASLAIYSFYLVEVSTITTSQIVGLSKLRIPAIIVISGCFIIEWVQASIFAANPGTLDILQIIQLQSVLYVIVIPLILILTLFATVMLIKALAGTNQSGRILRFALVEAFILLGGASSLVIWCMQLNGLMVPRWQGTMCAAYSTVWYGCAIVNGTMAFIFSISVQKDIELSKSGTSSTSSSSSSKAGSSSTSSSTSDPVIEL